ncbi:MAG: Ppx/GppA phosphatase family protein [Bdellovibrionota bacterium]
MALRAGIDIGTNTILLLIAEVENGRVARVLEDHVRVVRLGQGVDKNRAFHPEAMERALACFCDYSAALNKYPGIDVRAVATSGSRDAANSGEFFTQVKKETGIEIRVISGEEEARMSFRGAMPDSVPDPLKLAVLDIGGGSTEIVGLNKDGSLWRHSFDMGCVRLTERFLPSDPPAESDLARLRAFVKSELAAKPEILGALKGRELVGVAGTATYLASSVLGLSKFDPERVQGAQVSAAQVRELEERFRRLTSAERLGIGGMDRGRADVIVAGAVILEEVLRAGGLNGFTASVRGLRYGAVLSN